MNAAAITLPSAPDEARDKDRAERPATPAEIEEITGERMNGPSFEEGLFLLA